MGLGGVGDVVKGVEAGEGDLLAVAWPAGGSPRGSASPFQIQSRIPHTSRRPQVRDERASQIGWEWANIVRNHTTRAW
jgi:hypothetical protein